MYFFFSKRYGIQIRISSLGKVNISKKRTGIIAWGVKTPIILILENINFNYKQSIIHVLSAIFLKMLYQVNLEELDVFTVSRHFGAINIFSCVLH